MGKIARWTAADDRRLEARPHAVALASSRKTIDELRGFVVGLARNLGRGRVDPEDLAQDVLERWLVCTPRLPPITNPRAWMAVVLRHLLFDRLRRQRVSSAVEAECAALVVLQREAGPWWRDLDAGTIKCELSHLPRPLRETFELFTFEARSYRQIAHQLNIAEGTVGVRISRARTALKRRLIERSAARIAGRAPTG